MNTPSVNPSAVVLRRIQHVSDRCACLLAEEIGGLLVLLGEGFMVRDLIAKLGREIIMTGINRLGATTCILYTAKAAQPAAINGFTTGLVSGQPGDSSAPATPGF